jgi:hypothetical protein
MSTTTPILGTPEKTPIPQPCTKVRGTIILGYALGGAGLFGLFVCARALTLPHGRSKR